MELLQLGAAPDVLRELLPAITQGVANIFGATADVAPPDESWRFVILGVLAVVMMAVRPEGVVTRTMVERLRFRRNRNKTLEEVAQ